MINYDELPDENPFKQPTPGTYFGVITNAEIRESQTSFKPYLNVTYTLIDKTGIGRGTMFDVLTESPKEIAQFKLKKFIDVLNIKVSENFELDDLVSPCLGKTLIVDTRLSRTSNTPRLEVDVFEGDIYYPASMSQDIFGVSIPDSVNNVTIKHNDFYDNELSPLEHVPLSDDMPF